MLNTSQNSQAGILASYFDRTYDVLLTIRIDTWRFLIYDIGGKMVAEYSELQSVDEGGVKYLLSDWQGSNRAVVSNAGFVTARTDYTAFGEEIGANVGLRTTGQKFGSNQTPRQKYGLTERDQGTGLDHTWFRKHENRAGRWTSPDPYNGSMALGDPQSFNRYSYVGSQPTNFVDPSGLTEEPPIRIHTWTYRIDWGFFLSRFYARPWEGEGIFDPGGGGVDGGTSPSAPLRDPCEDILAQVMQALSRVAKRARELQQDVLDLVPRGIITNQDLERYIRNMNDGRSPASVRSQGSVQSHEEAYTQARRNLRRRINNFNNNDCGNKGFSLPEHATQLAKAGVPGRIRPLPDGSLFTAQDVAVITVAGVYLYWAVSVTSRFAFPPRNLVPAP